MSNHSRMLLVAAALSAALAIMAGAFGAHVAPSEQAAGWLQTGATYQLIHAVAALALLQSVLHRQAAMLLIGATIFAGALYALALGAPRWFGAVAPIGGGTMILGWLWAAYRFWRQRSEQ
jgi:uncharacterized membrane protein YgdD (TMEM256/DUF423 family)